MFTKNVFNNSNLEDSAVHLPVFHSRANQKLNGTKLHNISITPKMIKMVITNLGLSKAPGPDYFLVVVLKNCEHVSSYILDELFDMCLTESCFPDCFKV